MTEKHELRSLPIIFIKGLIVVALAFLMAFGLNSAMQSFLDDEVAVVQAAAERAAKIEAALAAAENEAQAKRLAAELAVKEAEQYEEFYQKYKTRHCYHYYGQFYEMFENMYNADTIFIGTSHTAHGVNPLYMEEVMPEKSWFNFALNGSNPQYYLDWWKVFLESGYPIPETIVYCVDWFMCDDGWLWRRIDFDTNPDCPVDIMRKIKTAEKRKEAVENHNAKVEGGTVTTETETVEKTETPEKINWFDIDEATTYLFSRIPIIYSRDRIPEMIEYYRNGGTFETEEEEVDLDALLAATDDEAPLPEVPVYKHEHQADQDNNITSSYYKGYIPWERGYNGGTVAQMCNDRESQWQAFEKLLDIFKENDIHVVFVEVPEYVNGRRENKMEKNNDRIEEIAEKYGITFYNYNEELYGEINESPTNFSDWGHMNTKGSTAFSKLLAQDLKEYFDNLED
ncbi:MAG: hypothetical protein IKU40_10785 [Clostridia bacterium]|nr:hypothetical protein [Clostridia bacterium]